MEGRRQILILWFVITTKNLANQNGSVVNPEGLTTITTRQEVTKSRFPLSDFKEALRFRLPLLRRTGVQLAEDWETMWSIFKLSSSWLRCTRVALGLP
jgi:hypothetical protein